MPPMFETGSYRQAAMQEPSTVSSNSGFGLARNPPIWMDTRVRSELRPVGRRVPGTFRGLAADMSRPSRALVDAVADRPELCYLPVDHFRVPQHQIAILLEGSRKALKKTLMRRLVEIDQHVAAENHVKLFLHGPGRGHQIEPVKMYQRSKRRLDHHLPLMRPRSFQEITAQQRFGDLRRLVLCVNAGGGARQHVGVNVRCQNADTLLPEPVHGLQLRHGNRICLLTGRGGRAPDA